MFLQVTTMLKRIIIILCLFSFISVKGNGYKVPFLSHKYNGLGHAGTALSLDAAAVYFNPAGTSFLEQNQINFGAFGTDLKYKYLNPNTGYEVATINDLQTPFHIYGAWRLKGKFNKFSVGFGIYTPFGSTIKYPEDWIGRYITTEFSLKTIFFQPTVSYQVNEKLSIGFGAIIGYGSFGVTRAIPLSNDGVDAFASLDASSIGFGFELGLMYKPTESLSVGFRYSSKSSVGSDKGSVSFRDVPESVNFLLPETNFSGKLTIPQILSLGLAYEIKKTNTLFAVDIEYTNWRVYEEILLEFEDQVNFMDELSLERKYDSAFTYRVGIQQKVGKWLTLRAGTFLDKAAVPDCCLTPETPGSDKYGFTLGASIQAGKRIIIDLSYQYFEGKQRTSTNEQNKLSGTYKTRAIAPGIGISVLL